MIPKKSVDVVIPCWNGRAFLDVCLTSLKRQFYKDFTVIVVDNGSTDGSTTFVRENYPEVKLILLGRNTNFSGAVNAGIKVAKGDYVALLNQDTEADPRWLEQLIKTFESHPEIDFCASKLLYFKERDIIDSAGDGFLRGGASFKIGSGERDGGKFRVPREIFGACAAASIYRRVFFDRVGLFDDDLGDQSTDGDLNFRAQLLGLRCFFVPTAIVYHHVGASIAVGSPGFIFRTNRNAVITIIKNYPLGLLSRNILMIALVFFSTLWIYPHPISAIRGRFEALRRLPYFFKKRKEIQKKRIVSLERLNTMMSRHP
ncbi:MAG: glycosyltransferase family 2 protein [Candidatus Aminicenantes bacterium]|jgi:GT2 family glycosyltransferase